MKITINTIKEATRKDGTKLEGVSKNGRYWKIWRINDKYSYFSAEECDLEVGKEYECEVEEKKQGQFTNYTITKAKLIEGETGQGTDRLAVIEGKIDEIMALLKREI